MISCGTLIYFWLHFCSLRKCQLDLRQGRALEPREWPQVLPGNCCILFPAHVLHPANTYHPPNILMAARTINVALLTSKSTFHTCNITGLKIIYKPSLSTQLGLFFPNRVHSSLQCFLSLFTLFGSAMMQRASTYGISHGSSLATHSENQNY